MNLHKIISEELQKFNEAYGEEWYDDDDDQSLADKIYANRFGINAQNNSEPIEQSDSKGKLIGFVIEQAYRKLSEPVPVYLNPTSLSEFSEGTRGILMADGDFYLALNYNALHYNILMLLADKGIVSHNAPIQYDSNLPEEFVAVERKNKTNTFEQSSTYHSFPDYYGKIFDMSNNKHQYKFKLLKFA